MLVCLGQNWRERSKLIGKRSTRTSKRHEFAAIASDIRLHSIAVKFDANPRLRKSRRAVAQNAAQSLVRSLNYLICAKQQRLRDRDSERACGLEIYREVKVRRLLNGQIRRICPFEYLVNIGRCAAKLV